MTKTRSGEQFLHERNPHLQKSREVDDVVEYLQAGGETIPNSPEARLGAYLGFLGDREYANDGILTGDRESIQRQIDAHVIKSEDVPESYFTLQQRIARERGEGDIELTHEHRRQLVEAAQAEQRAGLEKWVEYLGGDDGGYPDWFKYYTWESLTKLGAYDKEKKEFKKRSRGMAAAYPELNREALAYTYDVLAKSLEGEATDSEELARLLESANFGKLYAYAVLDVTPDSPELRQVIEGSWRKYDQTSDPRTARRLSESLQGHGTGWCTAGESTAAGQLRAGDFYVYYSRDTDDKDTIPRVAIRMEGGQVAEVRGINDNQNLEGEVADIAMEKLANLPGGPEYQKKADDMRRLTDIERLLEHDEDTSLSPNDVRFLYEMDTSIEGFGYEKDPRIAELRAKRGERDHGELARVLPEVLMAQARAAYDVYRDTAVKLTKRRGLFSRGSAEVMTEAAFVGLLERKEAEWQANGVMDYLVRELVEKGSRPNLVATPNVLASWEQIRELAKEFGEDQPYETHVNNEFLRQYSPEELSGAPDAEPVRLSIIPSAFNLESGTVEEQREWLEDKQTKQPELHYRVPSMLDAVQYWQTLRARGVALEGDGTLDMTYIRHFDAPVRRDDVWSCVPGSGVGDRGWADLDWDDADFRYDGRLSVG